MSLAPMMLTRKEREVLIAGPTPHYTGFTPRPIEQLSIRRKPTSSIDIECRHRLRLEMSECVHKNPSIQFRLWLEAGKHRPPYPEKPDASYNSNVWRNFRRHFNFSTHAAGQKIPDVIAAMYPLNIPKPSQVGDHTFTKYLQESKLFENEKYKTRAVERTKTDLTELKRLRIKTEARNPPIDKNGSILPPENFKKHILRFIPPKLLEDTPHETSEDYLNMFCQRNVPIYKPPMWKLSTALNNPQYKQVRDEIDRRNLLRYRSTPPQSRVIPTPNSSVGQ